jgi:hypothetical protein
MLFNITARGQNFLVDLPDSMLERACEYALGVVAQRETAGMGEKDRKPDGSEYTEKDRTQAIADRFAKIAAGEWAAGGGGRAADPATRELCALLRVTAVRKKAKKPYETKAVPSSSDADAVAKFAVTHFGDANAKTLSAKAARIAKEKVNPLA